MANPSRTSKSDHRGPRFALSEYESNILEREVMACDKELIAAFNSAWLAWKATWNAPGRSKSNNPASFANSQTFDALIELGPAILPLLMAEMRDESNFPGLQAVQVLASPSIVSRPQSGDIAVLGGEQFRTHGTIQRWIIGL